MTNARIQQEVTLTDDTAFGANLDVPYLDDGASAETHNSSGEIAASELDKSCTAFLVNDKKPVTVLRGTGNLTNEFAEFMSGVRRYYKNIFGYEFSTDTDEWYRELFAPWNTFLQWKQGEKLIVDNEKWIAGWLPQWNMFLQTRAGDRLVICWNLYFTIAGFMLYMVDMVSDIGTSMYYASNGQWWQAMVTLAIVYGTVIIYTVWKWIDGQTPSTGSANWLRYVCSLFVNWPNVKQFWALCLLEWKLYKSRANSAHLIPEWHERRVSVALLKFTEGVCEACPQAILQLCLLLPELFGDLTWTEYLRIASASVSLCTAGAALVNREKCHRINDNIDVSVCELVVLHVWAVPVTVCRLLSVALLLSVHPYWALAGVALLLVLRNVYWCRTKGPPRALDDVMFMCLNTIYFLISPFGVAGSITSRRVYHIIHFLVNTAMTVVWALDTPLECPHPVLYTAIISFNVVVFTVGLLGWQLHEKYWRR